MQLQSSTSDIDQLATLTVHRDRDLLDVTLVETMRELYRPISAAVYVLVGPDPERQRWLMKAKLGVGDVAACSDPSWIRLDDLPQRADMPDHARCIDEKELIRNDLAPTPEAPQGSCKYLFPAAADGQHAAVLEMHCAAPLSDTLVRAATSVIRIYRNFSSLIEYSERDTLTGLLNRKTFDEAFYKTVQAAAAVIRTPADGRRQAVETLAIGRRAVPALSPTGTGHWLGVIDIDHFKRVNDTHGHLIGDEVLLLVGRIMRTTFRFQDRLYRFGGEEFVVLLRCPDEYSAGCALERLRVNLQNYAFPQVGRVTVSAGYAEVMLNDTPTGAFERADKAVYYAKQNGRNQVCSHSALVAAGHLEAQVDDESAVELF